MRTLWSSLVGAATLLLAGSLGVVGAAAQEDMVTQPVEGLFTGAASFLLSDACEAGGWTVTEAVGETSLGRAALHSEHCPQTSGPSSTDGTMRIIFEDASTLTATYAISSEPLMPTGPALVTCTPYAGEVTGGSGRFEGATGSIGFDPAMVFFDGVDWPAVGITWAGVIKGAIAVPPTPEAG